MGNENRCGLEIADNGFVRGGDQAAWAPTGADGRKPWSPALCLAGSSVHAWQMDSACSRTSKVPWVVRPAQIRNAQTRTPRVRSRFNTAPTLGLRAAAVNCQQPPQEVCVS